MWKKKQIRQTHQIEDTLEKYVLQLKQRMDSIEKLEKMNQINHSPQIDALIKSEVDKIEQFIKMVQEKYGVNIVDQLSKIDEMLLRAKLLMAKDYEQKRTEMQISNDLFDLVDEEQLVLKRGIKEIPEDLKEHIERGTIMRVKHSPFHKTREEMEKYQEKDLQERMQKMRDEEMAERGKQIHKTVQQLLGGYYPKNKIEQIQQNIASIQDQDQQEKAIEEVIEKREQMDQNRAGYERYQERQAEIRQYNKERQQKIKQEQQRRAVARKSREREFEERKTPKRQRSSSGESEFNPEKHQMKARQYERKREQSLEKLQAIKEYKLSDDIKKLIEDENAQTGDYQLIYEKLRNILKGKQQLEFAQDVTEGEVKRFIEQLAQLKTASLRHLSLDEKRDIRTLAEKLHTRFNVNNKFQGFWENSIIRYKKKKYQI